MDPQQTNVFFVSNAPPEELPLKSFHFFFGIIQMMIAALMIAMEVVAIRFEFHFFNYVGIYCGIIIFLSGLFSVLGAKMDSRPPITACIVFNIFATIACSTGIVFATSEVAVFMFSAHELFDYVTESNIKKFLKFGYVKSVVMLICCILEFFLTIVLTCLSCRSVCSCCRPISTGASGQQIIAYKTTPTAQSYGHPQKAAGVAERPPPQAYDGPQGATLEAK